MDSCNDENVKLSKVVFTDQNGRQMTSSPKVVFTDQTGRQMTCLCVEIVKSRNVAFTDQTGRQMTSLHDQDV